MSKVQSLFEKIVQAKVGSAIVSPLSKAERLSDRMGRSVYFKREDIQPIHSFKLRGAYNKAWHISKQNPSAVFCCASAGNHAQGVALAGKQLGHRVIIVVPQIVPEMKVIAIKRLSAKVVRHGNNYDEAYRYAKELALKKSYAYIHPFDDPLVIAGQGKIGLELHDQAPDTLQDVFVPVGGGGLLAGVSCALEVLRPNANVIAVEATDSSAYAQSLQAHKRITLPSVGTFADGTAVKQVGALTWRICKSLVTQSVCVSTDEICNAIKLIYEDTRCLVEPSGALAVAGLLRYYQNQPPLRSSSKIKSGTSIALITGANSNFHSMRFISERSQVGEKTEAILGITIPERHGAFLRLVKLIGNRKITECNYRYQSHAQAQVFCGIEVGNQPKSTQLLITKLEADGYNTKILTDSEIAKTHVRYMIGGACDISERVFRFAFPERPGALLLFLREIARGGWNISLFHYRNHGSDYGRVLCGFQYDFQGAKQNASFLKTLNALHVDAEEVSTDAAYQLFLKGAIS